MSSKVLASTTGLVTLDTSAANDAGVLRDSNGDDTSKTRTASTGLIVGGFLKAYTATKTANFTVDEVASATTNATIFLCDPTSGSITVTLPAAAGSTNRVLFFVKTVAANSLILDGNGSETINGATTKTTTGQYAIYAIACDGSNWFAINIIGTWT